MIITETSPRRHKRWVRAVAWALVITFINQDIVRAQGVSPAIPKDVAVTREVHSSSSAVSSGQTIITIQDAHAYLGAQESIVSILDSLVTNYDLKVIAVEGSAGYIDTSLLKTFPREDIRNAAARRLMEEGRMSAGEFFAVTSGKNVALYGIEDDPLYRQNLEEFRRAYDLKTELRHDIDGIRSSLEALKEKIFSPRLKELDQTLGLYREGKISFGFLWEELCRIARDAGIDCGRYRNLSKLVEASRLEKVIDFGKATKERDALISALTAALPKKELEGFVLDCLAFKKGKISPADFYTLLTNLARDHTIDTRPYASLNAYAVYIALYESVDIVEMPRELEAVESTVKEALFRNDDERHLNTYLRFFDSVDRLFAMQLDTVSFAALERSFTAVDAPAFDAFVAAHSGKVYDAGRVIAAVPEAMRFFRTAEKRNRAMLDNTIKRMREEGRDVAALITGGYHTSGLTGLLKERNASYLVILPKFDASRGERPYVTILTNKKQPYEPLLKTGLFYIATNAYFARDSQLSPAERKVIYVRDFRAVVEEAVAGAADGRERSEMKKSLADLWSGIYKKSYDEFQAEQARRAAAREPLIDFIPETPEARNALLGEIIGEEVPAPAIARRPGEPVEGHAQLNREFIEKVIRAGKATTLFARRTSDMVSDVTIERDGRDLPLMQALRDRRRELPAWFDVVMLDSAMLHPDALMHPGRQREQAYINGNYIEALDSVYTRLKDEAARRALVSIMLEAFRHEARHIELEGPLGPNAPPAAEAEIDGYAPSERPRTLLDLMYNVLVAPDPVSRLSARDAVIAFLDGEAAKAQAPQPFGHKVLAPGKSRVIYVTAEMKKIAQAGGLGDVSLELPEYLNTAGNEAAVITPAFGSLAGEDLGLELRVPLGEKTVTLGARRVYLNGVLTYLLVNPAYFTAEGPYAGGDQAMLERFALLSAGSLELMKALSLKPDAVNAADWHSGLVPLYMKALPAYKDYFKDVAVNVTVHNFEYKGLFGKDKLSVIAAGHPDIVGQYLADGRIEYDGQICLLKSGVIFADTVNTVGVTYFKETQRPEVTGGFADILRRRAEEGAYTGILNGISHTAWNPATEQEIVRRYDAATADEGKEANKLALQRSIGLAEGSDKFVISFVGRLDWIKGVDLILDDLDRIMAEFGDNVEVIIQGPKVNVSDARFDMFARKYKGRFVAMNQFPGPVKQIMAGSDIVVIPSRFGKEPCNLVQMQAMRFGAVPVVFRTGGLADVISNFDSAAGTGNGFLFDTYTPEALHQAVASARTLWKDTPASWRKLVSNGMTFDSTWKKAAGQYEELYRQDHGGGIYQAISSTVLRYYVAIELIAGMLLMIGRLYVPNSYAVAFVGFVAGVEIGYALTHWMMDHYIRKAFAASRVSMFDAAGNERRIARHNRATGAVEYLYYNLSDPTDVVYDSMEKEGPYQKVIDNIPKTSFGNTARYLILRHEQSHLAGYGELMAYLLPGIGSGRMPRERQALFIKKVAEALGSGSPLSNSQLIAEAQSDRQTLRALVASLEDMLETKAFTRVTVRARAYLLIGFIKSRYRFFGRVHAIENSYTAKALREIKNELGRSLSVRSGVSRIASDFMDQEVVVNAPVRVDLSHGGASDLFAMTYEMGGRAVNIAVDLDGVPPIQVRARRLAEPVIRIYSKDQQASCTIKSKAELLDFHRKNDPLRLFKAAFIVTGLVDPDDKRPLKEILQSLGGGIELTADVAVPRGSGLGVSGILGACVLKSLYRVSGEEQPEKETINAGLYLEQILDIGGGWQDIVGGTYGGIKLIESKPGVPDPVSTEITVPPEIAEEFEDRCVLYYTGASHFAGDILQKLVVDFLSRSRGEFESRKRLAGMDDMMADAIRSGDIDALGKLTAEFWKEWKILNPEASNDDIETLFKSVEHLTIGGKLCGAGGGGFAFFIAKKGMKKELEDMLNARKPDDPAARCYAFKINRTGLVSANRPVVKDASVEVRQGVMYMAVPREHWSRGGPAQEEYEELIASRRASEIVKELKFVFGASSEKFFRDFFKIMPPEHRAGAAAARLIDEAVFGYLMSLEDNRGGYAISVTNPPDAAHTELMIFGPHAAGLINDATTVLRKVTLGDSAIDVRSTWAYTDPRTGFSVNVFELADEKTQKPLVPEQMTAIKDVCAALHPGRCSEADFAVLCGTRPGLAEELARIEGLTRALVPREIPVSSVKGEDVLFVNVKSTSSFINSDTIIKEDIWTSHDSERQRQAKITTQQERMREALAETRGALPLDEELWAEMGRCYAIALEKLSQDGKSAVYTLSEELKPFISALVERGEADAAEQLIAFLADIARRMDAYTYLADDAAVAEELDRFDAVVRSCKADARRMLESAQTAEEETAAMNRANFIGVYEREEVENFVRTERRRAYIKIHETVKILGPLAKMNMEKIIAINRNQSMTPTDKYNATKPLEGIIDLYTVWAELLRMMHNYGHSLPRDLAFIADEAAEAEEALAEIDAVLSDTAREEAGDFLALIRSELVDSMEPGGRTSSHIVRDLAVGYSLEHPDLKETALYISALFTSILEGRKVPVFAEQDQPNVMYVTDVMDQRHAFRFVEKNPRVAVMGAKVGNSRSHWVITLESMLIEGRDMPIIVIPGVEELMDLADGQEVILDAERRSLVIGAPKYIRDYYEQKKKRRDELRALYAAHASEPAVTLDEKEMTVRADVPRIAPDAFLAEGRGADGIGLIRMENLYMKKVEPTEEEIYAAALRASEAVEGPLTFRTMDAEEDKIGDMASIKSQVLRNPDKSIRYTGVPFYFEDPKGNQVMRTTLRALMRAYAKSSRKNIRITIPMVETEDQAEMLAALAAEVRDKLIEEGAIKAGDTDGLQFGAMIETGDACLATRSILDTGFFSYISIGTNDLAKPRGYTRDDKGAEIYYHELQPAFRRSIETALAQVDEYNATRGESERIAVCTCGEWAKSRKFLFYMLGLMHRYPHIDVDPVTSGYKIGELKEYVRHVSAAECEEELRREGDLNANLAVLVERVGQRIDQDRGVGDYAPAPDASRLPEPPSGPGSRYPSMPSLFFMFNAADLEHATSFHAHLHAFPWAAPAIFAALAVTTAIMIARKIFMIRPGASRPEKSGTAEPGRIVIGIPAGTIEPAEIGRLNTSISKEFPGLNVTIIPIDTNQPEDAVLTRIMADTGARSGMVLDLPYAEAVRALKEQLGKLEEKRFDELYPGIIVLNRENIGGKSLGALKRMVGEITDAMPAASAKSLEDLKAMLDRDTMKTMATVTHKKSGKLTAFLNNTRTTAVSITTQDILDSQMLYALRDKIDARWRKLGITSKDQDPIKELVVITDPSKLPGDAVIKAREKARKYIDTIGLTPYVEIVMPGELSARVASLKAQGIQHIGIRSKEGEIDSYAKLFGELEDQAIKLELGAVNGVYFDTNSYEVLLELLARPSDREDPEKMKILGITKNEERNIFRYIPRAIPFNYEEEIAAHRAAIELLLTAA